MVPVVVDCSALAEVVLRSDRAPAVVALFGDDALVAPDLIGAGVLSVVRRALLRGLIDPSAAGRAVQNLASAPVRRMTTEALVTSMWAMHPNVAPYDACYVALARALAAPLITLDERLARAPDLRVELRTPG